ncbi:MAG: hypothetical protein IRZ20_07855 [Thermoleophilia bacterium]|nr:hypothetical protein [Thermoleophilia bacterium]
MEMEDLPRPKPERTPAPAAVAESRPGAALSTAELAECTCPDFCERDHANE